MASALLKIGIIQWIVFILVFPLILPSHDRGDMGVVILGAIEYSPYFALIVGINISLIAIAVYFFKPQRFKWIIAFLSTGLFTAWFIVKSGEIEILYWKVKLGEFIFFNMILCTLNLIALYTSISKKSIGNGKNNQ